VLVLRPAALGDTLLTVPALRALRSVYAPLTLAAHGAAARFLAEVGEVDRGIAFDDASLSWLFGGSLPVPDEPVVAWLKAALVPRLASAVVLAPSRPREANVHVAEHLLRTLAPLGCSDELDERPLHVEAERSDEVFIHVGSGSPAKNWPAECFASVIQALGSREVRLIVGEADADAAEAVEAKLGRAMLRLGHAPIAELAARLAGCHAYLGNDSGVSHLAGLCGAPTVVVFGPTSPAAWRPLGPRIQIRSFQTPVEEVAELLR
jgi:heptosyltransferase-3